MLFSHEDVHLPLSFIFLAFSGEARSQKCNSCLLRGTCTSLLWLR